MTTSTHPVAGAVAQASSVLSGVREQSPLALTASEVAAALAGVAALRGQLAELETRLVEHAATVEVEQESGAKSTADWWPTTPGSPRAPPTASCDCWPG